MPKSEIKKEVIDPVFFRYCLKKKNTSIRKIGNLEATDFICNERTIRRALKDQKIRFAYLDAIGKLLNIDTRYLSGEVYKKRPKYAPFPIIEDYPYKRKALDENKINRIENIVDNVLMGYEISEDQYDKLSFDEESAFLDDLFNAISSVMGKHFKEDAYGKKIDEFGQECLPAITDIYYFLMQRKDYHEDLIIVQELRKKHIATPPVGYSKKDIEQMTDEDIWELEFKLNKKNEPCNEPSIFESKYPELFDPL